MALKSVLIDFSKVKTGEVTERDLTTEEAAVTTDTASPLAARKRTERNELLFQTDWMACSDVTMSDEWKTYRQALRDLPAQSGFPDVDFPTKPS